MEKKITIVISFNYKSNYYHEFNESFFKWYNGLQKITYVRHFENKKGVLINIKLIDDNKLKQYYDEYKNYFKKFPLFEITAFFDKCDIYQKIKIIENYWIKFRWNYLRNLAAWKYHPSKMDFSC